MALEEAVEAVQAVVDMMEETMEVTAVDEEEEEGVPIVREHLSPHLLLHPDAPSHGVQQLVLWNTSTVSSSKDYLF